MRQLFLLSLATLFLAACGRPGVASDKAPALTDADKKKLDQLIKDFLFDPEPL